MKGAPGKSSILGVLLAVALLATCGEPEPRNIETRILCVWDGADLGLGGADFGSLSITPHLSAWRAEGRVQERARSQTPSASSAFANFLTGLPVEEHGLRSVREPAGSRLLPTVSTRAQDLPAGTTSLASVSRAHFELQGLGRGISTWLAPKEIGARRVARDVWEAARGPLDAALATDERVFLVLHFSDLRDGTWRNVEPTEDLLRAGLAPWVGKGGEVDEELQAEEKEESLASRLSRRFSRRTEDPRRQALEQCYQAAALRHLDGLLGELRGMLQTHHRLDAARLELDFGANPGTTLARGQTVQVSGHGDFANLEAKLNPVGGESFELVAGEPRELARRGAPFLLQFKHPQLFYLSVDDIQVGSTTLQEADVFLLLARRSDPWPEHAFVGPLLDFQKAGGRRLNCRVDAPEGKQVELLLTTFPPTEDWVRGVDNPEGAVEFHGGLPHVARVTGSGPLRFSLPQPAPSARLGVVLRVDGARVNGSRMRYLDRLFITSERLDLGFSEDGWLQKALRGDGQRAESAAIHVQLQDRLTPLAGVELFSPDDWALLQGLHEHE